MNRNRVTVSPPQKPVDILFVLLVYGSCVPLLGVLLTYLLVYLSGDTLFHRQCDDTHELFWSAYGTTRMITMWTCFHLLLSRSWLTWAAYDFLASHNGIYPDEKRWGLRWHRMRLWAVGWYCLVVDTTVFWWRWWAEPRLCDQPHEALDLAVHYFCLHGVDTDLPMRITHWICTGTAVVLLGLLFFITN